MRGTKDRPGGGAPPAQGFHPPRPVGRPPRYVLRRLSLSPGEVSTLANKGPSGRAAGPSCWRTSPGEGRGGPAGPSAPAAWPRARLGAVWGGGRQAPPRQGPCKPTVLVPSGHCGCSCLPHTRKLVLAVCPPWMATSGDALGQGAHLASWVGGRCGLGGGRPPGETCLSSADGAKGGVSPL